MKSWKNDESRSLVDLTSFWQHYFLPAKQNLRLHTPSGDEAFFRHAVCQIFEVYWWLHLGVEIGYYPKKEAWLFLEELNVALSRLSIQPGVR